jgi:fatty-acyl-CoA synthase
LAEPAPVARWPFKTNREEKMNNPPNGFVPSYVHGANGEPLLGLTIGQALDRAAVTWADQTALIARAQGIRWTWHELRDHADAFAAGLLALGLRRGDRIGIWSLNRAEWTLTQFAAARAGLILVTINPAYRLSELEFALNKVGCRWTASAGRDPL